MVPPLNFRISLWLLVVEIVLPVFIFVRLEIPVFLFFLSVAYVNIDCQWRGIVIGERVMRCNIINTINTIVKALILGNPLCRCGGIEGRRIGKL